MGKLGGERYIKKLGNVLTYFVWDLKMVSVWETHGITKSRKITVV